MAKIKIGLSDQDKINMANDVYNRAKADVDGYVQEKDTEIDGFMDTVTNNFNELSGQVEGTLGEQTQAINDFKDEVNGEIDDQNAIISNQNTTIAGLGNLQPQGVATEAVILAKTTNQGIWIGSDTGKWYYWDANATPTGYVAGGVYQASAIADNSVATSNLQDNCVTTFKADFIKNNSRNLFPFTELNGVEHTWSAIIDYEGTFETNTKYTLSLDSTFISSDASSNKIVYVMFYYTDNTNSGFKTVMGTSSNNTHYVYSTDPSKTLLKIRFQQGATLTGRFDNMMFSKGSEAPYQSYYAGDLKDYVGFDFKITEDKLSCFEYGKYNYYQPTNQIDNYYFYLEGVITANSNFWYDSTFFPIKPETQYYSNCIICEYDENFNFIARHGDSVAFTTLLNAKYYRISGLKARKDIAIINEGNKLNSSIYDIKMAYTIPMSYIDTEGYIIRRRIDITTDDDFVVKMKQAFSIGNCDVYIASGTYDLSNTDVYTTSPSGVPIGNNCKYYFATNSKVICNYTGDDTSLMNAFSLLFTTYTYGDFELHNFNCETSRIRYAIHDECGSLTTAVYRHIYDNCMIKHDNTNHPNKANFFHCIGGGLGYSGEIIINNCYFNSVYTTNGDISYHANSNGSASVSNDSICKLTVTNSYFEHTISLSVSGVANKQIAMISNNSFASALYYNGTGTESKWQTYAWNNEIRS